MTNSCYIKYATWFNNILICITTLMTIRPSIGGNLITFLHCNKWCRRPESCNGFVSVRVGVKLKVSAELNSSEGCRRSRRRDDPSPRRHRCGFAQLLANSATSTKTGYAPERPRSVSLTIPFPCSSWSPPSFNLHYLHASATSSGLNIPMVS